MPRDLDEDGMRQPLAAAHRRKLVRREEWAENDGDDDKTSQMGANNGWHVLIGIFRFLCDQS